MCMSGSLLCFQNFFISFVSVCLLYQILVCLCVFTLFYFISFICPFLMRKRQAMDLGEYEIWRIWKEWGKEKL